MVPEGLVLLTSVAFAADALEDIIRQIRGTAFAASGQPVMRVRAPTETPQVRVRGAAPSAHE